MEVGVWQLLGGIMNLAQELPIISVFLARDLFWILSATRNRGEKVAFTDSSLKRNYLEIVA